LKKVEILDFHLVQISFPQFLMIGIVLVLIYALTILSIKF